MIIEILAFERWNLKWRDRVDCSNLSLINIIELARIARLTRVHSNLYIIEVTAINLAQLYQTPTHPR